MKATKYGIGVVGAVLVVIAVWGPLRAKAQHDEQRPPRFKVDPFWPKPLPDRWVTGEVGGTCLDSHDHLFTVNRASQNGLIAPETVVATASPPIIEYNRDGDVVNAWGNLSILPNGLHGCFVDYQDNVWIAGNGDGIVQKYTHDGRTLLLQIGTRGVCDTPTGACGNPGTNSSHTLLDQPADIAVDPANGDVYIADGYGNHRVVVFDRSGHFLRQWGSSGTGPGQFQPADGGHPHCVVISRQRLVYACDRGSDRIQVFDRFGNLQRIIPVRPGTAALGTAGSAWDLDFSPDTNQTFFFESDGGNEVLWTFDRALGTILTGFGRPGHQAGDFTFLHTVVVDSRGNLYTGETIGGRRVQKFVKLSDEGDD
jgi:DNA-binding beta-propeller fold protein YncE